MTCKVLDTKNVIIINIFSPTFNSFSENFFPFGLIQNSVFSTEITLYHIHVIPSEEKGFGKYYGNSRKMWLPALSRFPIMLSTDIKTYFSSKVTCTMLSSAYSLNFDQSKTLQGDKDLT